VLGENSFKFSAGNLFEINMPNKEVDFDETHTGIL